MITAVPFSSSLKLEDEPYSEEESLDDNESLE
jgi:hypothetical protein